jgi:hypothetical protein
MDVPKTLTEIKDEKHEGNRAGDSAKLYRKHIKIPKNCKDFLPVFSRIP